ADGRNAGLPLEQVGERSDAQCVMDDLHEIARGLHASGRPQTDVGSLGRAEPDDAARLDREGDRRIDQEWRRQRAKCFQPGSGQDFTRMDPGSEGYEGAGTDRDRERTAYEGPGVHGRGACRIHWNRGGSVPVKTTPKLKTEASPSARAASVNPSARGRIAFPVTVDTQR